MHPVIGKMENAICTLWDRRRDRMVVRFTATCAISAYHHSSCDLEPVHGEVYSVQHYVIKFVGDV